MLLRVRLLNVVLSDLLHHEVGIDIDGLGQRAVGDTPLAADGENANRRLSVDERIDTVGHVGQCECVCSLERLLVLLLGVYGGEY